MRLIISFYDDGMHISQLEQTLNHSLSPRPPARWQVAAPASPSQLERIMRDFAVPPLLAQMLHARGLHAVDAVLEPPLTLTEIPALLEAAQRIKNAIEAKKTIMIHGDYDADGITGTAVLTLGLRALGATVVPYIPNRLTDGYGIHPARVAEHAERCQLFITVDCGVTNLEEIAALQHAGVEVIVSDHHQPGECFPDCLIVHPKTSPKAGQGLPELTGAGVAYHLLWQLHTILGLPEPLEYSDIATIGTIADVAPLMGENRALVQRGLLHMRDSVWIGMRALLQQTKIPQPSARDVAFMLAPRLNAAGRLGEADLGLEMLITASSQRAKVLANYLEQRNQQRQSIQQVMFEEALTIVDADAPTLVVADTDGGFDWNPGIMGIVASKLLERFYKPVYIIAKGKGSVRSTPAISAVEGLHRAKAVLKRYGGHSQAAGFSFLPENTEKLRQILCDYVAEFPRPQPEVRADALLYPKQISRDILEATDKLEPFGQGIEPPTFALCGRMDFAKAVGREKNHLQLRIAGVKGVSWNKGFEAERLRNSASLEAAVSLNENIWQGKRSIEFIAEEVRPAQGIQLQETEATSFSFQRGIPEGEALTLHYDAAQIRNAEAMAQASHYHLYQLPLDETDLLNVTQPLTALVQQVKQNGKKLFFDLGAGEVERLEQRALLYPSIAEMRLAFSYISQQKPIPFVPQKATLCQQILQELNLINAYGRTIRGEKRDPYSSDTLVKGMLERYKLFSLLSAYQHLDDAGFDSTVKKLF